MMAFLVALTTVTFGLMSLAAEAAPYQQIIRMPRMMAMGGAGTALADDEYALFQNPAGLAGSNERRFKVLGMGAEVSSDTIEAFGSSFSALSNFQTSDLNTLMGKDIAVRAGAVPMIRLPGFSIAYIADFQGSINQFNQANPFFDVGFMTTHGVQGGIGFTLPTSRHARSETRLGVAAKMLWRKGGFYSISTAGFLQATNEGKAYIDNLVGQFGVGLGLDVGIQQIEHMDKTTTFFYGLSVTDVGNTRFSDSRASPILMSINLGTAYQRDFAFMKLTVAADLKHLNERGDLLNKSHFGIEVGIPLLDFYVGLNQLNPSYGVAFDIWVLKVSLVSFAEELGVFNHQNTSRKTMLQADFSLPI